MLLVSDSGPDLMSVFGQRFCFVTFSGNVKAQRCDARGLIQESQDQTRPGLLQHGSLCRLGNSVFSPAGPIVPGSISLPFVLV